MLQQGGVLLDAVCVGGSNFSALRALARSTGGYCFRPRRLRDALKLNEVRRRRRPACRPAWARRAWFGRRARLTLTLG